MNTRPGTNRLIGSPIERLEDMRFLRGRGEYVDDVPEEGVLHAVILRSAVAHGRIRSIDVSAALQRPGVHAVITAAEIGNVPRIPLRQEIMPVFEPFEQPVIAADKVRYVGEPLAVVVAETPALAEDALEAILVDIEILPSVADRATARKNESLLFEEAGRNHVLSLTGKKGDAASAFKNAPYTRREHFELKRATALAMEPRGVRADWDASRATLTVYGMTKVIYHNRRVLAKQMGIAEDAITVIENDIGGGFGVRGEFYPEDFLIPFAARHVGGAVKWIEDRREHFISAGHARDVECDLEIACDLNGIILGLRGSGAVDLGAYIRTVGITPPRNTVQVLCGAYRITNYEFEHALLLTNKVPAGTFRGPGRVEADFCRERLFDMAARDLGIDQVEFRRRNLVMEHEVPWELPTVQPVNISAVTDTGDYHSTFNRCLEDFGWAEKAKIQGTMVDGRLQGIAICCYLEGGGAGPQENARIVLEADATFSVFVGSSSVGQGVETVLAQIAADTLDVPMERINQVQHGTTTTVKEGFGTYSSRTIVMGGSAITRAAAALQEAIRAAAAKRLGCGSADLTISGDRVVGPAGVHVDLSTLAADGLSGEGNHSSTQRTYTYGSHAIHVAVDPGTGHVAVLDYVAVEDVGRVINPLTMHGQVLGGVVQGLGGALLENLAYDADGQFLSGTLADYLLPTASDFPFIRSRVLEEKPCDHNPLGAKGGGDGPIIPAAALVGNAVANAIGVETHIIPLTPPAIWELIQKGRNPDQRKHPAQRAS